MSHADTLMWNMEQDPLLRSTITAVAVFDRTPGWVVDPDFDLSRHVRRVPAPPPGELRWALEQAQVRASAGFDRSRPLWDCTLVEGLAQGRAAAVATVHHSWADGVGGVALLAMMFGLESGPVAIEQPGDVPVPVPQPPALAAPSDATVALDGLVDSARNVIHGVPEVSTRIAGHVARLGRDPRAEVVATARVLRSVARFLAPAAAPMSPLMRARSGALSYDVFDVELARLRAAAKAESGSVNDGFLAAAFGAAVNVTLFSHAGWCCIAVSCDRAAVPDNDVLVECLRAGFADVTVSV